MSDKPAAGHLATITAKPQYRQAVRKLLQNAYTIAEKERDTLGWYALELGETSCATFGIHSSASAAAAYLARYAKLDTVDSSGTLLDVSPQLKRAEVLASQIKL